MVTSDHAENVVKLSKCSYYKQLGNMMSVLASGRCVLPSSKQQAGRLQHSFADLHVHECWRKLCLCSQWLREALLLR